MHVFGPDVPKLTSPSLTELLLKDIGGSLLNGEDKYVLSEEGMNFLVHILNQQKTKGLNNAVVVTEDHFVSYVQSITDVSPMQDFHSQIVAVTGQRSNPRQRNDVHYPAVHMLMRPGKPTIGILADHYYGYKSPLLPKLSALNNPQWFVLGATDDCTHYQTDHTHCYVLAIEFLRYMNKLSIDEIESVLSAARPHDSGVMRLRWQDLPVKFMRDYQSLSSLQKYKRDPTSSWPKTPCAAQKKFEEKQEKWTTQLMTPKKVLSVNARITNRTSVRLAEHMTNALSCLKEGAAADLISICYSTKPRILALLQSVSDESHPLFSFCFDNIPYIESQLQKSPNIKLFFASQDPQVIHLQSLIPMDTIFKMTDKQITQLILHKDQYCQLLQSSMLESLGITMMSLMNLASSKSTKQLFTLSENLKLLSEQDIQTLTGAKLNDTILKLLTNKQYRSSAELLKACRYIPPDLEIIDENEESSRYNRAYSKADTTTLSKLSFALKKQSRQPLSPTTPAQEPLESSSSDEEYSVNGTFIF